jgi:peptidyl-tRNA hydrolase, PTH1 family
MTSQDKETSKVSVVVGLGNPGRRYERTRHNVGFMIVDEIGRRFSASFQERLFRASWGTASIRGHRILLFKPKTYMNRSGEAVSEMLHYFRLDPSQMLVVHDDLDLSCGRLRLVRRGSAGGHRGIQSIIQHVGLQDFPRFKLGIGRPLYGEDVETYVLDGPYGAEQQEFDEMIRVGVEVVEAVVMDGLEAAMNRFNQRSTARLSEGTGS